MENSMSSGTTSELRLAQSFYPIMMMLHIVAFMCFIQLLVWHTAAHQPKSLLMAGKMNERLLPVVSSQGQPQQPSKQRIICNNHNLFLSVPRSCRLQIVQKVRNLKKVDNGQKICMCDK